MPIYEYECEGCHKVHEVMQKFSDAPLAACPECGKSVHKIMSRTSFALKGTGWYSTDYKKSSVPPPSTSGSSVAGGTEAKPTSTAAEGAKTASAASDSTKTAAPAATPASVPPSSAASAGHTNKTG
jgi:putative FmdB family regulatory protein